MVVEYHAKRCAVAALVVLAIACCAPASSSAVGDVNELACGNSSMPAYRTSLPDCRAYELVTPPYKAGYFVEEYGLGVAESGEALIGESLGNFGEEAQKALFFLRPYRMSRTPAGWTTAALLPSGVKPLERPGKVVYAALARHVESATGETLWDIFYLPASGLGEPEDAFEIQAPDGTFHEVGPVHESTVSWGGLALSAGPKFVAASRAMEHIVFSNRSGPGESWKGDTTRSGAESLYEYEGAGHSEPKLVGVYNQHALNSDAEAELISQCGTTLGASYGEKYNALAEEGKKVFFTALQEQSGCTGPPVDELYSRIEGERTRSLSEPTHNECEECNTSVGLQRAQYQGAAADGSRVYFLTSQEMLPGAHGLNLYEYDFAGAVHHLVTLVSAGSSEAGVQGVVRVSSDGSHVYFVARAVLAGANGEGREPAAEADNLYVYEQGPNESKGHIVFVATLAESDETDWEEPDISRPAAATDNGEYLVFTSSADLTPGDTSTRRQLFEYDASSETLTRISVGQRSSQNPSGYGEDGNASATEDEVTIATPDWEGFDGASGQTTRTMSGNGSYVFFQTPLALTPAAANNTEVGRLCTLGIETEGGECKLSKSPVYANNVYEYHWTGNPADGNTYLISSGKDEGTFHEGKAVHLIGTDVTGANVFFTTSQELVPSDTDTQEDIYDARVGGGFPETSNGSAGSCGAGCERPLAPEPQFMSAASATWPAGENVAPPAVPRLKARPRSTAQKLASELKACRRKRKGAPRRRCERAAHRRFTLATRAMTRHGRSEGRRSR